MAFCADCGGQLDDSDQFCGQCGKPMHGERSATPVEAMRATSDAGGPNARGRRLGGLVVASLIVVAIVIAVGFVLQSGSSSQLAMVFESGSDGYGDVYFVPLGDETSRESRALEDVRLAGSFYEASAVNRWVERDQMRFAVDGGVVIAYTEEDEEDVVVAVVAGREVTPAIEERGSVTLFRTLDGSVLASVNDWDSDRCEVYRIDSAETVTRLGRGELCGVSYSGDVVTADNRSNGSDVTVSLVDGTVTEIETDDAVGGSLHVVGDILPLRLDDIDSGLTVGGAFYDVRSGNLINDLTSSSSMTLHYQHSVLTNGLFIETRDDREQAMHFLSSDDDEIVATGDNTAVDVNPARDHAILSSYSSDHAEVTHWLWSPDSGTIGNEVELDYEGDGITGWASSELALIVQPDGDVIGLHGDGTQSDLGDLGVDVAWGWVSSYDSGLSLIHATSEDGIASVAALTLGAPEVRPVHESDYQEDFHVSENGRYVVFVAVDSINNGDRTLYVYDTTTDDLVDLDDNADFAHFQLLSDTLRYVAYDSDGDAETLEVSLTSGERPEVLYRDAVAIAP